MYTLIALSEQLKVAEPTLRYRLKPFYDYIQTIGSGKNRRYADESLPVIAFIMDCYNRKLSQHEIIAELDSNFPKFVDLPNNDCGLIATETEIITANEIVQLKTVIAELVKSNMEMNDKLVRLQQSQVEWFNTLRNDVQKLSRVDRNKGILTKVKEWFL